MRAKKLKIACVQGLEDKRAALRRAGRARGVPLAQVAYVGNDINDLGCLQAVGVPVAVQDAHEDILGASSLPHAGRRRLRRRPRGLRRSRSTLHMPDALFDVAGKVVVITGALGQLGTTFGRALLERGAIVAALDLEVPVARVRERFGDAAGADR